MLTKPVSRGNKKYPVYCQSASSRELRAITRFGAYNPEKYRGSSMSNALLIGLLIVIGVGLAFLLLRRKPAVTPPSHTSAAAPLRESLLQIVIPPTGACCAAAHKLETTRFNKGHAPPLPLADCSMKTGCLCRYQPVPERRIGERRTGGHEKREVIRYEENPRRKGHGRRAVDKLFDHEDK
jgi:hypothetical protein